MERRYRHEPDFFFPVALITAGVVWLLVNNGTIPAENIARLLPYWPVLLILGGLSLILRRIWWPLPSLLWLAAGAGVIWLLLAPGSILPRGAAPEFKRETLRAPLDGAQSAEVELDLSINPATIHALEDSNDLIVADVAYLGDMIFETRGTDIRLVRLDEDFNFQWTGMNWMLGGDMDRWDIGLATGLPMDLTVDMSTGNLDMDLSALEITALALKGSTGNATIQLPEESPRFRFDLNQSTGNITVVVPEGSTFDMDVDGSTGGLTMDVADGAGVQIEIRDGGPGNLRLPDDFRKVQGDSGEDEGVWENDAYATSDAPIRIAADLSTGNITIK